MRGFITALLVCSGFAHADVNQGVSAAKAPNPKEAKTVNLIIDTSKGKITLELYPDKAPATVSNMLSYVDAKFYDGTIFHRVIDGFMIQGGGFTCDMLQKRSNAPIKNEADNGLRNERGTIAMARTSFVDSATSQFFINLVDNSRSLNFKAKTDAGYGYCVFGKVIDGMDVVDMIGKSATGISGRHRDVPKEPVIINSIRRHSAAATEDAAK